MSRMVNHLRAMHVLILEWYYHNGIYHEYIMGEWRTLAGGKPRCFKDLYWSITNQMILIYLLLINISTLRVSAWCAHYIVIPPWYIPYISHYGSIILILYALLTIISTFQLLHTTITMFRFIALYTKITYICTWVVVLGELLKQSQTCY